MKKHLLLAAVIAAIGFTAPAIAADNSMDYIPAAKWEKMSPKERAEVRAKRQAAWTKMTPEERKTMIAKRKEEFAKLSPEEKKAREEAHARRMAHRAEMKAKYANASPEEKARIRQEIAARKAKDAGNASPSAGAATMPAATPAANGTTTTMPSTKQ